MATVATTSINIDQLIQVFGVAADSIESSINSLTASIAASANPSQADLLNLQALTIKWQNILTAESSVMKMYGDTMKSVVQNIGS